MRQSPGIKNKEEFIPILLSRINEYFTATGVSDKGNWKMAVKICLAFLWWSLSYSLLYLHPISNLEFILLYIFHGLSHAYIFLNIAHDANHGAISNKSPINRFLSYSFDICGISSYVWRILHHKGHHYCINIQGEDETFFTRGFFRFSPHKKKAFIHRYQHRYVFIIYGLLTLDWIFTKDIEHFFFPKFKPSKETKRSWTDILFFIFGKVSYLTYMIVLPVTLLDISPLYILLTFFITHFIVGIICSFILQIVHPIESAEFPASQNEFEHFVYHVFATTADYSTETPAANWFFGGLNLHVIHHIKPNVCHVHFPALTKILKATANEHGIEYRENKKMITAIKKHCRWLKKMGSAE